MTRLTIILFSSTLLLLSACGPAPEEAATAEAVQFTTEPAITAAEFLENIEYLAADELQGRGNGTPELDEAARAIAANFKAAGLEPFEGSYMQNFEVQTGSDFGEGNALALEGPDVLAQLNLEEDYVPLAFGEEDVDSAEVVFVGYGISAPEHNYDDYAGVDVKGKVVLALDLEPQRDNQDSVFDGSADSQYAQTQSKIIAARINEAAGIIIFRGPDHISDEGAELPKTGPGFKVNEIGLNAAVTTYEKIKPVLDAAGIDVAAIQSAIDADLEPQSQSLEGVSASIAVDVTPVMATVNNVVGYLEGTDQQLMSEYVVLGAHYDHLGLGYRSSMRPDLVGEVHNGADDNASGTSGLMETAEYFASIENRPARSMLFIAFAAEEWGLLGSDFFIKNPLVPKEQMVAMLNMDMIGRADEGKLTVGGTGTAESFAEIVDRVGAEFDLEITSQESGFASSDNASFTAAEIPALFYFTGTHGDYHKPSDDADLINAEDGAAISRLVAKTAAEIANASERPEYVQTKVDTSTMRTRGGSRPWFGSMPDFGYEGDGYKFNMITEGSPAWEAGFRGGDIMIAFGGKEVGNIYDYTAALRSYQPGDEVDVTVLRDGEEITSTVKLTRRPGK